MRVKVKRRSTIIPVLAAVSTAAQVAVTVYVIEIHTRKRPSWYYNCVVGFWHVQRLVVQGGGRHKDGGEAVEHGVIGRRERSL